MSAMSLPIITSPLTERQAVEDTLYRALLAWDDNDAAMFKSSFTEDATFDLSGQQFVGYDTIRTQLLEPVGALDTLHQATNVRIHIDEGTKSASLTASVVAQHAPTGRGAEPDSPKFTAGSRYLLHLVKDEQGGLWKVDKFTMKIVCTQGDYSVMPSAG